MNRRDLLGKVTAALAGLGIGAKASAIEAEPKPLALVVTLGDNFDPPNMVQIENIKTMIKDEIGPNCPPVIVCCQGVEIEVMELKA